MTKEKLKNEAREYLAEHSEYSEVFEETFIAVDTLTAMVDFAEPREKQIQIDAEQIRALQKQNGELTDKVKELEESLEKLQKSTFNMIDEKNNRIADLEEENAELKEKYAKNITDCDICDTYCNSQLTKAKEFLKKVLDLKKIVTKVEEYLLLEEAEQFLSEMEK